MRTSASLTIKCPRRPTPLFASTRGEADLSKASVASRIGMSTSATPLHLPCSAV